MHPHGSRWLTSASISPKITAPLGFPLCSHSSPSWHRNRTQANADRAVEVLVAHPEVDIAVFPELFLGGYDLSALPTRPLDRPDCPELRTIAGAAAASRTAVVIGFAERAEDGTLFNSVACIDRDGSLRPSTGRRSSSATSSGCSGPARRCGSSASPASTSGR